MTEAGAGQAEGSAEGPRRRRTRTIAAGTALALVVVLAGVWFSRDRLAGVAIDRQLRALDLPARYRIDSIAPDRAVLRDVVVGNPARPDLVIPRAELHFSYGFSAPGIDRVTLERPRLYGTLRQGRLSLGALDRILHAPRSDTTPPRLPDLSLRLVDGRALIESDMGAIAAKADGQGNLRDGFHGTLAALAPSLALGGCTTARATLFGTVSVKAGKPRFDGPVRAAGIACPGQALRLAAAAMQVDAVSDGDFRALSAKVRLRGMRLRARSAGAETLALDGGFVMRGGVLSGRVAGNAGSVHAPAGSVALLGIDGLVRARDGLAGAEFRGTIDGQGLRRGPAIHQALQGAERAAAGTLFAPMAAKVRTALAREERGSRFGAEIAVHGERGGGWSLVVPSATLRGGSGAGLLALSRVQLAGGAPGAAPRLAGNFSTGGQGLPQIAGRMERGPDGGALFRLTMADYRAGDGRLAVPRLMVAQGVDGTLGFAGEARLSGAIPGGSVTNLALPVHGGYGRGGALTLWTRCVSPVFDALELGAMRLDRRALTVCPASGGAIVRSGPGGTRIAAGTPSLALSGRLGQTPLRLTSGPVGFAWPGTLTARQVDVALGPEPAATRLRLDELVARLGRDFTGRFGGVEARLAAVPLDITEARGNWRYAGGRLMLDETSFRLTDRMDPARFEPLAAQGATLVLADNQIDANALLREAKSEREVVRVAVRHDLGKATGHADLAVESLRFDPRFQPDDLTRLALGVVANVAGSVTGRGRIDWRGDAVTSSGRFSSDGLDLAAAFGPARGLAGTLEFTDLLGLVTAPHQRLRVASVNPGIEVNDGVVDMQLLPGQVLRLNGATWPFLGGTLTLEPTDLTLGVAEPRRYVLTIAGLDAAKFVERMDLGNIAAAGVFDGQLPLVFDAEGGRIVGGTLVSRPPGGNVSYVGALTYKDLSAMANFAFDALKSLDYKAMTIAMQGDLEGEIVTNVRFGGVRQGAGTRQNFLTRKVANLPIQFNVTIRAPFYQLITSVKAMYDPAMVKDPRTLGLVDGEGRAVRRLSNGVRPGGAPVIVLPGADAGIQHPDSGNQP